MMTNAPFLLRTDPPGPARARLLWLPALGVPARKYQRFAGQLAAHGIAVAVHEWRGTGDCPRRPTRQHDWGYAEWLREDVPASAEAMGAADRTRPLLVGGHSIGGQMAVLAAALGVRADGLLVVGSGVPHWRLFPSRRHQLAVGGFGAALPLLTRAIGHYPGDRLRFAGREAGQLMRDWAGTVRRGHYDGLRGLPPDLEARLAAVDAPLLGLRFADDWLVPQASLDALVAKTGARSVDHHVFDRAALGTAADHFAWMREPAVTASAVAAWARRRGLFSP